MTLLYPSLRSTCMVVGVLALANSGIVADESPEQRASILLSQQGIEPTAKGAITYLQRLKPNDRMQSRVKELIEQLSSETNLLRERASEELTMIGEAAEPQLREAVKSRDLEQMLRARRLLNLIQSHRDSNLRDSLLMAALVILKRQTSTQTPTILLDVFPLLDSHYLHSAACEALWANVQSVHENRIRAALSEPHLTTRIAAIVALELAVGEKSVDDLQELLNDEQDAVRLAASRALLNHLPRQCLQTLVGLLAAQDLEIRMQASMLLQDLTGRKFGNDSSEDFETVANRWKRWADTHANTARLEVPVGNQRLELSRAVIVFRESFAQDAPSLKDGYNRFRYESTMPANASVADGLLRFHGDHPEADQRLYLMAKNLTGGDEFPRRFLVKTTLTGEAEGMGGYHVGVSVGRIKVLLHPAYPGGGFRVETTDNHDYLISNQSMGFTPLASVMHGITLKVSKEENNQVRIEATVTNGKDPRQKYVKQFECDSDIVGSLNRIGLERSGRAGGAGLFGPVTIDLSGNW